MRRVRKLVALLLSLAMVLAMSGMAMASSGATLDKGEVGGFTQKDTPEDQGKIVNIAKEITVFNPNKANVYGPAITYTYTVTPGSANKSITDDTSDHNPEIAVTTTTLAGLTTKVVVNGGTEGNATSAAGNLEWTNADLLDASANGTANTKYFTIDFSEVAFTQPGVYSYVITESHNPTDTSVAGVTETTGSHVRYLDVYVMRSTNYVELGGSKTEYAPSDWTIYGYVCASDDQDITPSSTTKTNGFVAVKDSTGNTTIPADQYHTFNLTIGKTLTGDAAMAEHKFPFDVAWENTAATGTFQLIVETNGTVTITKDADKVGGADALNAANKDGNPSIANGGTVTYIGIPCGTKTTVTETNDVIGTKYSATVTDGGDSKQWTNNDNVAVIDNGDSATYAQAAAPAADTNVTIQVTNKLETISPTGLMFRYGPYALILICGVVLLFLGIKFTRRNKEED